MEIGNVVQFFEDKTILVTGTPGFLAKILVEKILRIQPNVKKLILLLRASESKSATQRLHDEVLGTDLFNVLRSLWGANLSSFISEKVLPISGDISYDNLGIHDSALRDKICREVDIIVNSAATTRFDERYDVAMGTNVLGAMHTLNFAKKCAKLRVLLHVSTAYVCGKREGIITEKPFYMGETLNGVSRLNIDEEKMLVEETLNELRAKKATPEVIKTTMRKLGIQRAKRHGWPHTYAFTKAMGEMQLVHFRESLPIIVLRPTIITSTYKEPFPGWLEGLKTIDSIGVAYAKGKLKFFAGDPQATLDLIPADMVVNSMIVAMVAHANQNSHVIYHVGSSQRNPFSISSFRDFAYRYFRKHPWVNEKGKPIKVRKLALLTSMASFRLYMAVSYSPTIKMLQLTNMILCQGLESKVVNLKRRINLMMRLVKLYEPYLFFKGIFHGHNTEKLQMIARESGLEEAVFYFDPRDICWEDYFMNVHFPAIVNYLLK